MAVCEQAPQNLREQRDTASRGSFLMFSAAASVQAHIQVSDLEHRMTRNEKCFINSHGHGTHGKPEMKPHASTYLMPLAAATADSQDHCALSHI